MRILGPDYSPTENNTAFTVKKVTRAVSMMADRVEVVDSCPAGNIVGLVGVDKYIRKSATITGAELEDTYPLRMMKFTVAPVVRVAVECKRASDAPKLVQGIAKLINEDQLLQHTLEKTGEHVIAGAGELHIKTAAYDLQHKYMKDVELIISEPVVSMCETLSQATPEICLSKSPNKHNRIFMSAEPLDEKLTDAIADGSIAPSHEAKERTRMLCDDYGWNRQDARKIWSFGVVGDSQCNLLVDKTRGCSSLHFIKDLIVMQFGKSTMGGALCDEPLRGTRFNLMDAKIHADPAHRGAAQIFPATRRVLMACQLSAKLRLLEPMFMTEVRAPPSAISGVFNVLQKRQAQIDTVLEEDSQSVVRAFVPVRKSFKLADDLRGATRGEAFAQTSFSHWQTMPGDPFDEASEAHSVVMDVRKRKGMKPELPKFSDYMDRL